MQITSAFVLFFLIVFFLGFLTGNNLCVRFNGAAGSYHLGEQLILIFCRNTKLLGGKGKGCIFYAGQGLNFPFNLCRAVCAVQIFHNVNAHGRLGGAGRCFLNLFVMVVMVMTAAAVAVVMMMVMFVFVMVMMMMLMSLMVVAAAAIVVIIIVVVMMVLMLLMVVTAAAIIVIIVVVMMVLMLLFLVMVMFMTFVVMLAAFIMVMFVLFLLFF